jgi:hypothetical protein
LNSIFKYDLTQLEKVAVLSLYESFDNPYIYQFPGWQDIIYPDKKKCYFLCYESDELVSYAIITEKYWKATLSFGPVAKNTDYLAESICQITDYYKSLKFGLLIVQLSIPASQETEYIENSLHEKINFNQTFNTQNWSSLILPLDNDIENIFKNFTKGHKSDIKKAEKMLVVKKVETTTDIDAFSLLYDKMYQRKKIPKIFKKTACVMVSIHDFFKIHNNGFILGVYSKEDDKLLGGIVIVRQGKTILYLYGAKDFEENKTAVLHLALFEAIKIAKFNGCRYFDFGGYNHFASENNQIFYINRFKKGFGGQYIFYPKLMLVKLNIFKYWLIKIITPIYMKLK